MRPYYGVFRLSYSITEKVSEADTGFWKRGERGVCSSKLLSTETQSI